MSRHLQSIIVFGYLPSFLITVALVIGVQMFRSGIDKQRTIKQADYRIYGESLKAIANLEGYLGQNDRRAKMTLWNAHLDVDFLQSISTNLAEILGEFSESEIQNTAIGNPGGASQIAANTENNHSRVNLTLEGHYSAIQKTVTELEFRMPMISLESMTMRPIEGKNSKGSRPHIRVELNYLCWHRPQTT